MKLKKDQRIIKNFVTINVAFVLLFSAVNCTNSIQPIINFDQSLGTISQSIIYAVQILTSLVLPQVICELVGFKWALALGEILHLSYVLVQIEPNWYTFMPASVLAGVGNSLCWTIVGIYITLCSKAYSKLKSVNFVRAQTIFFGIFTSIYLTCKLKNKKTRHYVKMNRSEIYIHYFQNIIDTLKENGKKGLFKNAYIVESEKCC